jgi:hypothetical protein
VKQVSVMSDGNSVTRKLRLTDRLYLTGLGLLLLGYALAGRGFAYLGVPPIYVGEIVLAFGLILFALAGGIRFIPRVPLMSLIVLFCGIGAAQTIPYLSTYGLDAARDAVLWGYTAFAWLTAFFLWRSGCFVYCLNWYRRLIPLFLIFNFVFVAGYRLVDPLLPRWPGTEVPIIGLRPGDVACHLAGIAAFLALGLHRSFPQSRGSRAMEIWCWIGWLAVFAAAAASSRAGMVAVIGVFVLLLAFRGIRLNQLGLMGAVSAVLLVGYVTRFEIPAERGRNLSAQQLVENGLSTFTQRNVSYRDAETRQWRLDWWNEILDYTIDGPFLWTGKGYGVNLALDDGFDTDGGQTRSPHNGHLTILARSGLPGFAAWILLQLGFVTTVLRAYFSARRHHEEWWARVDIFVLAYWLAFMINGSFDVFFESPQGGIWLWSVFGFGLAAAVIQRAQIVRGVASRSLAAVAGLRGVTAAR